jgi:hypothetical protein
MGLLEAGCEGVLAQTAVAAFIAELVLELAHAVVGRAGRGAAQDQRAHRPGREAREPGDGAAAHRLRDHVRAIDAQMVEQCDEVSAEYEAADRHLAAGEAPAASVVDGAAKLLGEGRDLLPPGEMVPAGAVEEDEVGAIAVLLVVDAGGVDLGVGHMAQSTYLSAGLP